MAIQRNNLLYYDNDSGVPQTINQQSVALASDLEIGGNLTVLGTMSYIDSEILTSDAYLLMNSSYQGAITQNGGLVINTSMAQSGGLISVTQSTNTVVVQGVHVLAAGDIFALIETENSQNDSLYEVASSSHNGVNTTVVLKAVVSNTYNELLRSSTTLVDEGATVGAVGGKVAVAILRSDAAAGRFEYGLGSNTGLIVYNDIAASSLDLQVAYENGNAIVMTAANGGLDVSPGINETVGISLDASGPSNFTVSGNDALSIATAGGQLAIESNTGDLRVGTANTAEVKVISGATEGANDVYGRLLLDGNTVSLLANGANSSLALGSQGNVSVNTNNGDITMAAIGGTGLLTALGLNAVMLESVQSNVSVLAGGNQILTAGTQGAGSDMTLTARGGDLTIRSNTDAATGTTVGQIVIDANLTGGTALLIDSEGAVETQVDDGAYTVTTNRTTVASPIQLSATDDSIDLTAGTDINLVSTGLAKDIVISSIGALPGLANSGSGGDVLVRTDALDADVHSFTIDASTHGALANPTGSISAEGGLTLTSSAGDINASTPNTQDIKILSGDDSVAGNSFGRLLLDGAAVSLKASGNAGGDLVLEGDDTVTMTAASNGLSIAATTADVSVTSGTTMSLTAGTTLTASSTGTSTLTATDDVLVRAQATAGGASTLTLTTDANGQTAGQLAINAGAGANMTTADGDLALQANNGDLTIQGLNGGTQAQIQLSTNLDEIQVTSGNHLRLTSAADKTIFMSAGSSAAGTGAVSLITNNLVASTGSTTFSSTGSSTLKTTNGGDIFLDSTGDLSAVAAGASAVEGASVTLKGTSAAVTQQVKLTNSDSDAVIEVERSTDFVGARLNQSVTVGSALPNIAGISDVGVGVKVTVEAGVDVGEILAVNANGRFDKALARRAAEGDPDLPQNPLGVACAPGQAAATTSGVFMSTVHGASVLIQLTAAPAAADVGSLVYLSPTSAGKGIITATPQATLSNSDGLTRISTLGYLLSSTAITVPGLSGNVSVYPVLWMVDILTDS